MKLQEYLTNIADSCTNPERSGQPPKHTTKGCTALPGLQHSVKWKIKGNVLHCSVQGKPLMLMTLRTCPSPSGSEFPSPCSNLGPFG